MKPLIIVIIFIGFVALVALCSIVKFATEMTKNDKKCLSKDNVLDGNSVFRFSKNFGVISIQDNHSFVASERFPYLAAVTSKSYDKGLSFTCFGAVILLKWILTAAHCKRPGGSHRVLLYFDYIRNHTQTYPIVMWRVHEDYNPNSGGPMNDIAVAKISVNLVPIISHAAVFTNRRVRKVQASVWKTVLTMDRSIFLTNDLAIYDADLTMETHCYEHYGVTLDNSLICVDMSRHPDCFVTEFGPIFGYDTDRVVGLLAMKPMDCESKVVMFTNVSAYFNWIIRVTGTGDESENEDEIIRADVEGPIKLPKFV